MNEVPRFQSRICNFENGIARLKVTQGVGYHRAYPENRS